jgi:hypothetical protein
MLVVVILGVAILNDVYAVRSHLSPFLEFYYAALCYAECYNLCQVY